MFMHMCSGVSISESKNKSLRLHDMNRAPFFASEMVLFKSNLVSMIEEAGDTGSSR